MVVIKMKTSLQKVKTFKQSRVLNMIVVMKVAHCVYIKNHGIEQMRKMVNSMWIYYNLKKESSSIVLDSNGKVGQD